MPLHFVTEHRQVGFLDPFQQFAPSHLTIEVRHDPLTGDTARVLSFRARPLEAPDHQVYLERSRQRPCPFCPENIERMTTRYLPADLPEGRLKRGGAVLFPNAFPYEAMNAVLVLTPEHYLTPDQVTPAIIANALLLAAEGFRRLARGLAFASVNWNYMMPAGAGLVHPHFQLAAGKKPTRFQAELVRRARAHARNAGDGDIAQAYLDQARGEKTRWLGKLGPAGWCTPFAPRAIYDVIGLVPGGKGLLDLRPAQVDKLAQGVARVLGFFAAEKVGAFNLAIHTSLVPEGGLPLMVRLVSRIDIPPMGVDEINYFEKLHDEMITFLPPEELAGRLRPYWKA
ncbi:MAG: hypothetical protein ACOZHQ_10685 [Thermodesulfobacteriota bacterium]